MSTAKYSVNRSPRSQWEHDTGRRISDHALERWDERTPVDSVSPERALELSISLGAQVKYLDDYIGVEEVWTFIENSSGKESVEVLFLLDNSVVTTVYTFDFVQPHIRALCREMWRMCTEDEEVWVR